MFAIPWIQLLPNIYADIDGSGFREFYRVSKKV